MQVLRPSWSTDVLARLPSVCGLRAVWKRGWSPAPFFHPVEPRRRDRVVAVRGKLARATSVPRGSPVTGEPIGRLVRSAYFELGAKSDPGHSQRNDLHMPTCFKTAPGALRGFVRSPECAAMPIQHCVGKKHRALICTPVQPNGDCIFERVPSRPEIPIPTDQRECGPSLRTVR